MKKLILLISVLLLTVTCHVSAITKKKTQALVPATVPSYEFIRTWLICQFPQNAPARRSWSQASFEKDYLTEHGGENNPVIKPGQSEQYEGKKLKWVLYTSTSNIIDLKTASPDSINAVTYAYTEVECSKPGRYSVMIGNEARIKAWFNGKLILDDYEGYLFLQDEHVISIKLENGINRILLKLNQHGSKKEFSCRIMNRVSRYMVFLNNVLPLIVIVLLIAITGYLLDRKDKNAQLAPQGRLTSLDALRGFTMFWLISGAWTGQAFGKLIHNPLIISQLSHCPWNGFKFYDLIFPLFLFMVGCSMPFSFSKRIEKGERKAKLYFHVIQRTLVLFVLGVIYWGGLDVGSISHVPILGVLQRIAICYFFASVIMLNLPVRGQVITFVSILAGYWLIMAFVPVPGAGPGVFLPGKNFSHYFDLNIFPHRWQSEGLFSSLPAIGNVLLGIFAGYLLKSIRTSYRKTILLLIGGFCLLVLGKIWGIWFPINKLMWTSSYVLYSGGWSLLLLALFYWIIDVQGYKKWAFPFIVIGVNAIVLYAFGQFIAFDVFSNRIAGGPLAYLFGPGRQVWLFMVEMALRWLFLYWLYKKKIFIKV